MKSLKWGWRISKSTFKQFNEDGVLRLSAATAYYAIFSIGPLLVLIIGLAGLVLGQEHVRLEVTAQLKGLVGDKSAKLIESMMVSRHGQSLLATIVGGAALVFGAAGVFGQLQDALNTIWEVKAKPGAGIWAYIRARFLSVGMVLGIGFLLLVSMVLSTCATAFAGYLGHLISLPAWVVPSFNELVSFVVITLLFALIFKVLPDVKLQWSDVWVGAIGTAILFTIGKFLLGLYLAQQSTSSPYGAATAFVLILMYVYYSSLILFLGAEFTQVYANRFSRVQPTRFAVPVTEQERAQEGISHEKKTQDGTGSPPKSEHGAPQPAFALTAAHFPQRGSVKKFEAEAQWRHCHHLTPAEQIRARPWSFVGLSFATGLAAGLLLKFKTLRKALKIYAEFKK